MKLPASAAKSFRLIACHPAAAWAQRCLKDLKEAAREARCRRIVLITTNDNIEALYFYQRRGFDLAHIYRNALDVSRSLKPEIPLIGEHGIPLRHEIEFEMAL